jgi:chromate transport protein ChrA
MFLISKNYNRIKNSVFASKILSKIIPVIVGLLIAISLQIGQAVIKDINSIIAMFISLILLIRFKMNPVILIFVFAITGFIFL